MSASRVTGVSVVLPTYNGSRWIERSIRSVLEQRGAPPIEVVVVDDCSKDDTVALVRRMADPRVRVVPLSSNRGVAGARNCGIDIARYDWIGFNDQDDIWLPDKLERQIALLDQHPRFEGVAGGAGRLARDGLSQWRANVFFWRWTPEHSLKLRDPPAYDPRCEGTTYLQTLLIAKDVLRRIGGFRERLPLSDDLDLFMRVADVAKLAFVQQPVFLYRLGDDNQTAPERLDAVRFLASHAYYRAAQEARQSNAPEPDLTDFFSTFQPTEAEVESFHVKQGLRRVNTVWVNRGGAAALVETGRQLARNPTLFTRQLWSRLWWWVCQR